MFSYSQLADFNRNQPLTYIGYLSQTIGIIFALHDSNRIAIATGSFVSVDKPTRGGVQIVEINGQRYVKLLSNFRTNGGPQLEVILHRNSTVSKSIRSRDSFGETSRKGSQTWIAFE